ncbi:MAG: hypothetical protein Q7R72_01890 [bacterium]|nr:hypothetical protein [bacterium]
MHPKIVAVWKKKIPNRKEGIRDIMFWHRDVGLLIDLDRLDNKQLNGLIAWAEVEGYKKRFRMCFDLFLVEFVFPEMFIQNKKHRAVENQLRNPWRVLKNRMSIHCSSDRSTDEDHSYRFLRPTFSV